MSKRKVQIVEPLEEATSSLPDGWTVTSIGTEEQPEYLVSHDGRMDNGVTYDEGCTFRIGSLDDLSEYIEYKGKFPVGHKFNPEPE
jgi:hypothetical protein